MKFGGGNDEFKTYAVRMEFGLLIADVTTMAGTMNPMQAWGTDDLREAQAVALRTTTGKVVTHPRLQMAAVSQETPNTLKPILERVNKALEMAEAALRLNEDGSVVNDDERTDWRLISALLICARNAERDL